MMKPIYKGNFRINTLTKLQPDNKTKHLDFTEMPIHYGLGIEKKCSEKNYIVVCFIKYDIETSKVVIEECSNRLNNMTAHEMSTFKSLCKEATKLVEDANKYMYPTNDFLKNYEPTFTIDLDYNNCTKFDVIVNGTTYTLDRNKIAKIIQKLSK